MVNNEIIPLENLKHLEFLATNSKEIIEKQVDSYRQQHSYAGTIIGATALFIPIFLSNLDSKVEIIQFLSIAPIGIFIWSILLMLSIFRTKPLDQAFSVIKYKDLLTKPYKDILLFEIEANSHSYLTNILVTDKGNKQYTKGVGLTTIALVISILLILTDKLIVNNKIPTKVEVVNIGNTLLGKPTK
jgi:hypothetical protein